MSLKKIVLLSPTLQATESLIRACGFPLEGGSGVKAQFALKEALQWTLRSETDPFPWDPVLRAFLPTTAQIIPTVWATVNGGEVFVNKTVEFRNATPWSSDEEDSAIRILIERSSVEGQDASVLVMPTNPADSARLPAEVANAILGALDIELPENPRELPAVHGEQFKVLPLPLILWARQSTRDSVMILV
ncbi:MAG: hypothetical protein KDD69_08065 [Bdellovibrionales bacterium]|nr:hypothetical protein [Bdellovibrionales bacterium]